MTHSDFSSERDGAASAAGAFSLQASPQMRLAEYRPYAVSDDVIGWMTDTWNLGKKSFANQFGMLVLFGVITFVSTMTLGGVFWGGAFALGIETPAGIASAVVGTLLVYVLIGLGSYLGFCACYGALESAARDEKSSFSELLRGTMVMAARLARLGSVITVVYIGIGTLFTASMLLITVAEAAYVGVPLALALGLLTLVLFPSLRMAVITMTIEETSVAESLRLGFARTLPNFGRYFVGSMIFGIVFTSIIMVVGLPALVMAVIIPFFGSLIYMFVLAAFMPFQNAWEFVAYASLRNGMEAKR